MDQSNKPNYAAVFIDFENIYYHLKNHYVASEDIHEPTLDLIKGIRDDLKKQGVDSLVNNAYADFERIPAGPLGPLYLLGVNTRNVLGTQHKNAADMQLCIDALEVLYTRPDINTFVLVAGDRDYIPLLQHLRRQGRQVRVVGFRESVSGDLLQVLGQDQFVEARTLMQPQFVLNWQANANPKPKPVQEPVFKGTGETKTLTTARKSMMDEILNAPPLFAALRRVVNARERECLAFVLEQLNLFSKPNRAPELWVKPFQRLMTDKFPDLSDSERRDLVNQLRDMGALRFEKRDGEPNPYSVITVNYDHPDVRELNPG